MKLAIALLERELIKARRELMELRLVQADIDEADKSPVMTIMLDACRSQKDEAFATIEQTSWAIAMLRGATVKGIAITRAFQILEDRIERLLNDASCMTEDNRLGADPLLLEIQANAVDTARHRVAAEVENLSKALQELRK